MRSLERSARAVAMLLVAILTLASTGCEPNALWVYLSRVTGFDGNIYVSAYGADTSDGTIDAPFATIQAGIAQGVWYIQQGVVSAVSVLVAAGTYEQNDATGVSVEMEEGVSLYGGYSSDFSTRDPVTYQSTIIDLSDSGDDIAAVRAESAITRDTVIDGFTIVGGAPSGEEYGRAVFTDSASPTISNNIIDAGSSPVAVDIYRDSDPLITGNTILANTDPDLGWKIALLIGDNSLPEVSYNTIHGGIHGACTGVSLWQTRCYEFHHNTVYGGEGTTTRAVVVNDNAQLQASENTFHAGEATNSAIAIEVFDSSLLQSNTNTIVCGSSGEMGSGITFGGGSSGFAYRNEIVCDSAVEAIGVSVDNSGHVSLTGNLIVCAGAIAYAGGVSFNSSFGRIEDNVINPGISATGSTAGVTVAGSSNLAIYANTISGGSGPGNAFGISIHDCGPRIDSNILFTTDGSNQKAIHEHDEDAHVGSLQNNAFYRLDPTMILYYDWADSVSSGGELDTIAAIESVLPTKPGVENVQDNVEADSSFVDLAGTDTLVETMDDNDWHLSATTPTTVSQGGLYFDDPDTDRDGNPRTVPCSIGAYEYD
jgi:hypothetical protein